VLPNEGFNLEILPIKGLKGRGMRGLIDAAYGVPLSLIRAFGMIRRFRPDRIIGLAAMLRARCYSRKNCRNSLRHHGTKSSPGFTNKLLARWVDVVFTAYSKTAEFFPGARVIETGNPVRWQTVPTVTKREKFSLLIFGGSLVRAESISPPSRR
jgi:UDP-N-acetylglucosamine--N-acetylmuramyl-(pentapeptide) pyrophosphoryl-undecaprenol N-acetylglucosamine transferase